MTKIQRAVFLAHQRGYRVTDDGGVLNPRGRVIKGSIIKSGSRPRYRKFTIRMEDNTAIGVPFHRLAAYQKFGDKAFEFDCTRHLNGDSLDNRPNNIAVGGHRDNALDREQSSRLSHALNASSHNIRRDWREIDMDRDSGMSYKALEKKHGVARSTLSYRYGEQAKESGRVRRYAEIHN